MNEAHLVVFHVGPVQEFIASARRSRDLGFGSWLMSELSKAAAEAIVESSGGDIEWSLISRRRRAYPNCALTTSMPQTESLPELEKTPQSWESLFAPECWSDCGRSVMKRSTRSGGQRSSIAQRRNCRLMICLSCSGFVPDRR